MLNSPILEGLALEITMLRTAMIAMSSAAETRERVLEAWRDEAEFWKREHAQTSREFSEFVELVGAKVT